MFGKYTGKQFRAAYRQYYETLQEKYPFIGPTFQPRPDQLKKKIHCRRERVREELQREFVAYGWREKDFEF